MSHVNQPILVPVILCGGAGSRLWPVSREKNPKFFIRHQGKSLLQHAFLRAASLPQVTDVITVTNHDFLFKVEDEYQVIEKNLGKTIHHHFILEPFGRNTAPAIAAAALYAKTLYGQEATLLILPADHLITNEQAFIDAVAKAYQLAEKKKIITFGIKPESAETGYGYIKYAGHDVVEFVEKPSLALAEQYVRSGDYLFNSGMLAATAEALLDNLSIHSPDILASMETNMHHASQKTSHNSVSIALQSAYFESVRQESIDYAVLEKTDQIAVVPCSIGWHDVGCWRALSGHMPCDQNNNCLEGDAIFMQESSDCVVQSSRTVGVVGVEHLVIIDTKDALLVANKDNTQKVKDLYQQLKKHNHETCIMPSKVQRPWGAYEVLEEGVGFKTKRIEVKPGAKISLQLHHHRSEHWVVVAGKAQVQHNEQIFRLDVGASCYIPATHKHRLENVGTELLIVIEVQVGAYLGEDDIVRFDDIYGRVVETA